MSELTVQEPGTRDIVGRAAPAGFQMIPKDMKEMMEFSRLISASNFIPKCFQGRPGDVRVEPPRRLTQAMGGARPGLDDTSARSILTWCPCCSSTPGPATCASCAT